MTDLMVDEDKLMEFVGKAMGDLGAALDATLVVIGDKRGLFTAMASANRPMTSDELAASTDSSERYIREWLAAMAAADYVGFDGEERYFLSPEQREALTNPDSPAYVMGGYVGMVAATRAGPEVAEAFHSGAGVGWEHHVPDLFTGTERFFRPGYKANLVESWIPALDGVAAKLETGAAVADIGCGLGASTILMGEAFPASRFVGFDYHQASIEQARERAEQAGLGDSVTFEIARADAFPGTFDLIAYFDCLHDMGDPIGALRWAKQALAPGGTIMLVEPMAGDRVSDNLNPVGRVFYAASTLICTPASLAQEGHAALGAQAGEGRLREVAEAAGLSRCRRVAETPFNMVLELRP